MSMFMSRQKIAEALRGRDVPRLLTRPAMDRLIAYAAGVMPERTVARITNDLVEAGVLGRVQRNVYVNRLASPDVTIEEIVCFVMPTARISLQTVLGDAGILNNPSRVVFAVLPLDEDASVPDIGLRRLEGGRLEVSCHGMKRHVFEAGRREDNLDPRYVRYARATPERALCDWIYLSTMSRPRQSLPPLDIVIEDLSLPRLRRLARSMDIVGPFNAWYERRMEVAADPEAEGQYSEVLGY